MNTIILTFSCFALLSEGYVATPSFHTTISAANLTNSTAETDALMPHHLYIGRCSSEDKLYHQQNFILDNTDERLEASTNFLIEMDGPFRITCVKVIDQMAAGAGAYPFYRSGGVGKKFVSFDVVSASGSGFKFHVEIYGRPIK